MHRLFVLSFKAVECASFFSCTMHAQRPPGYFYATVQVLADNRLVTELRKPHKCNFPHRPIMFLRANKQQSTREMSK